MKIANNAIVSVGYKLYVKNEEGKDELMEETTPDNPLRFMYGVGMMLPAFEKPLLGKEAGDRFSFKLSSEEAYGEYFEEQVVELARSLFEVDGRFDDQRVIEGATLPMMDDQGNRLQGSVLEVRRDAVVMDFNHPLAGEALEFEGVIYNVHEPDAEEIAEITGQGCGCSNDCDCEKTTSCCCK
ncbi:cystathionine beta-lyase, Bsu PatB [Candidatus Symbiothrix dinenymphae]|nr:cystathionine beta-lyase, Bsu PatB [Candidatus Symbiothrix dinenymphae]